MTIMEPFCKLPLSLLQNDIPASWIDVPKCSKCNVFYETKKVQHYPCRLACGHILCSTCLISIRKNKNDVQCGQCSQKIQKKESSDWYQLEYDYSLMGFINYQKNIVPFMLQNVFTDPNTMQPSTSASFVSVCVECAKSTKFICVQCRTGYCNRCFVKVHDAGVAFKKHQLKALDTESSTIGSPLASCKSHRKEMTYYCQTCSAPICGDCVSTAHSKHSINDLVKVNAKVDLNESLKTLKDVRDMIEESKKSTVKCIDKLDQFATATAEDIFSTFQRYHSILQNLEEDAYVELKKRTLATLQELHTVQNSIDRSGSLIAETISNIKQYKKVTPSDVDLSEIHNKIMTVLETLVIDFDVEQFDNNLFSFSASAFKTNCDLKDLCKIKFQISPFSAQMQTFFTAKKSRIDFNASSNHSVMSFDASIADTSLPLVKSKIWETVQKSTLQSTVQTRAVHQPMIKTREVHQPTIKMREVIIKEISDSMTFHVQDVDFIARSVQFLQQCNQNAMVERPSNSVVVGEMYLVHENRKDEWHRGVVTEQEKLITLYLVDYGRHVSVMLKHIRPIPEHLKRIPRSANEFTIRNVEPTGGKWSGECKELIIQMALENRATIIYSEENAGDCIIHLDYPTSVEETLLYLDYAKSRKIRDETENQLHRKMIREKKLIMEKFNKSRPFGKHVIQDDSYCIVRDIVSPAQLYISEVNHASDIEALDEEMQKFYGQPYHQKIYYPHLQMACCVRIDSNWYRARIDSHHPGCVVKVYLVDIGKHMNIKWQYLRALENQFNKLPEGVAECTLAGISPKDYAQEWGADVTTELKRLCKNKLRVSVIGTRNRSVNVELYIVKKTVNYQINAYLAKNQLVEWITERELIVERLNDVHAEVTNESVAFATEPVKKEFRHMVKILNTVSPSEFYVTFIKYENAIKKMHTEIQNSMKSNVTGNDNHQWKTGDHCLVFGKLAKGSNKSWYRGRIEPNIESNHCVAYLRDHGETMRAKFTDLAPISPSLSLVIDGASKCHLASLKPTSTDWARVAVDEFKYIVNEDCDTFSVSVHGEITNDSIPVYLWGRQKPVRDDALGIPLEWKNINAKFATKGLADCTETFKTIVDCNSVDIHNKEMMDFNVWHEKLLSLGADYQAPAKQKHILRDEDDFILEAELDPEHQSFCTELVTAWLPAKPISQYYFNACPTFVDNNAVIYLHEQARSSFLKQIMYTINKTIGTVEHDPSYKWKVNDPCMVQYYLDNCFYRGLVKEVLPNGQYKVLFVDYGNIETYEASGLRVADILGNVPIQATKYYLAYVKPTNDNGIWDKKILEYIHVNIVNKSVSVRVEDNIDDEYVPCTMTVGIMDLIKTLIAEKLAEYTPTLKVHLNLRETYNFYPEKSEGIVRDVDLYKESNVALDEFKAEVAKKNEATKMKDYLDKFDINMSADFIVEESDAEAQLNNSFLPESIDYDGDFQPLDTSTTISTAMKSLSLLPFKQIRLSDDVTQFPCKVYEVIDALHLFLEPIIQQYSDQFEIMENMIKKSVKKKSSGFDVLNARCCLAPYSKDDCYYRAVINDRISKTTARIRFVDYLDEEVVECKSLRECPADIVGQPLKNLLVKLHGVKPSRRIRDSDIKRQVENLIGQTAIAVVVTNDTIPSVHLYDNYNPDVLLYKSLIDSKFFIETRD